MFYRNKLTTKQTNEHTFIYNMFSSPIQTSKDDSVVDFHLTKECYNFRTQSGALQTGYGFEDFSCPLSKTDLQTEEKVATRGNEISELWDFVWYDEDFNENRYYSMYYNDENRVCYDDMFDERPATLVINTNFTSTPIGIKYKLNGIDSMILSGEGDNLRVLQGQNQFSSETAPKMISICAHYSKLFAITAEARGRLVYSENLNVLEWSDELTKNLDFSDGRGNLTKIVAFNDYVYLFREYGITKISEYSSDSEFSISHLYQSDSYIYPNSIAHGGDKIFFLEKSGLKYFNGSSVKNIELEETKLLSPENLNCVGQCYEGKYFLACLMNFDGEKVGCENSQQGYKNNALLVYDDTTSHVDITRGVDIRKMLALNNPYKSKFIACFYNDNKAKLGQLCTKSKCFTQPLPSKWKSVTTDFGFQGKNKRVRSFLIKTLCPCSVKFESDKETKTFQVPASQKVQEIRANVCGKEFSVEITSTNQETSKISNFVLNLGVEK